MHPLPVKRKKLVVVSGLAGSGKTVAIRALEDLGYYCIDNLPAALFNAFVLALLQGEMPSDYVALALDSRDVGLPEQFAHHYTNLNESCDLNILFLEARQDVVLKRFRETRRLHPLSRGRDGQRESHLALAEAIALDVSLLAPLRAHATRLVDTSEMTAQFLRQLVRHDFSPTTESEEVIVNLISFGFKHGVPQDVETLFDVRCFANPHYVDELRPLTGLNSAIHDFVFADANVPLFVSNIESLLKFLYPLYKAEGKRYFGVGIGCTGGKHRSVAIAEELSRKLKNFIPLVTVEHRHFDRE